MSAEVMVPISALCCLSSINQLSYLPKYSMRYGRMWIQIIQSFSKSCCKLMVQYEFRNMSSDLEKAGNQAQLELLMAGLLNVGIAICEILTFAMSELRSHVQLMVHQLLLSGLIISIHMILRRASVQKNQVYCWGILSLKPASAIGNTYFHAGTSFIAILKSNC